MRGRPRRWSLRLIAIWTTTASVVAAIGTFAANLKNIREFATSMTGSHSPAKLAIRDVRGTRSEQEGWFTGDKDTIQIDISFVIDKSGDKPLNGCLGQISFSQPLAFQTEKGKFNIEGGDFQRQLKVEIYAPKGRFERQAKFRITCPNIITPWADVTLAEIFVNPFPPL